ncbi:MAG: tRNA lysidine(34) synthetase TilS, partial [Acetobacteraceae bacterium]
MSAAGPISPEEFAALMEPLGPFEPAPCLAAAVSGGSDSLALALLADAWVRERAGSLLALIVDHGLRPEAEREVRETVARLAGKGIAARILSVNGLSRGPALAERARQARYAILLNACRAHGILHLLLGHHATDQAETVIMRALSSSGPAGLAGMARMTETRWLRVLRPLLAIPSVRLRATVSAAGLDWVNDPSNTDRAALRPRLRALRADRDGTGAATAALVDVAAAA